jgi:rhodanese-related sulfurtransferase
MASIRISPEEVNARALAGEPIVYLDTRNPRAWSESDRKIPGALRITADDIPRQIGKIARDATVVAYCTCPNEESSTRAAQTLRDHGYRAFALRGGFDAWGGAEYPVEEKTKAA